MSGVASQAMPSKGTLIWFRPAGTDEDYKKFAEQKDIQPPSGETAFEDVTTQESPDDAEEVVPTMLKAGQMTVACNYIPTDPTHRNQPGGAYYLWRTKAKCDFKVIYPDESFVTFTGWIAGISKGATVKGVLTSNVTFQPTGLPAFP